MSHYSILVISLIYTPRKCDWDYKTIPVDCTGEGISHHRISLYTIVYYCQFSCMVLKHGQWLKAKYDAFELTIAAYVSPVGEIKFIYIPVPVTVYQSLGAKSYSDN